jgi:hypothetical protein
MHGNGPLWLTVFEGPGNDAQAGQMFVVGRNRPSELNATLRYIVRELSLFPSRSPQRDQHPQWDQEFESAFLQRGVCKLSVPASTAVAVLGHSILITSAGASTSRGADLSVAARLIALERRPVSP